MLIINKVYDKCLNDINTKLNKKNVKNLLIYRKKFFIIKDIDFARR